MLYKLQTSICNRKPRTTQVSDKVLAYSIPFASLHWSDGATGHETRPGGRTLAQPQDSRRPADPLFDFNFTPIRPKFQWQLPATTSFNPLLQRVSTLPSREGTPLVRSLDIPASTDTAGDSATLGPLPGTALLHYTTPPPPLEPALQTYLGNIHLASNRVSTALFAIDPPVTRAKPPLPRSHEHLAAIRSPATRQAPSSSHATSTSWSQSGERGAHPPARFNCPRLIMRRPEVAPRNKA